MILVVGYKGNMGQRYTAILTHLNILWSGVDVDDSETTMLRLASESEGVIIASPTTAHAKHLKALAKVGVPVLCEKPFAKNLVELRSILAMYEDRLSMVFQYSELAPPPHWAGPSSYNYYKHGGDGPVWDCIQIIGLARGEVEIKESSPLWECTINGRRLNIADMDGAYITNVKRWLAGDYMKLETIYDVHAKTARFEEARKSGDRNPGPKLVR